MNMLRILKKFIPSIIDIDARGVKNIPSEGPALLVGDHPNIIDGLLLAVTSPRPVKILVAGELCTSPAVRRMIRNLGWLPVERHQSGKNGDTMEVSLFHKGPRFPARGPPTHRVEIVAAQPGAFQTSNPSAP